MCSVLVGDRSGSVSGIISFCDDRPVLVGATPVLVVFYHSFSTVLVCDCAVLVGLSVSFSCFSWVPFSFC